MVLIRGTSLFFHLCMWTAETNKSLCLSTSDTTMHSTHVPSDDAVAIITKDAYKWGLGIMMVIIPLHVFFNAPNKLQLHNIHRDINSNLLCSHIMRSRKSSIIWDIFHTDNSSALQDIREIRRIRRMAWNSANSPNDMKFGEFAESYASWRDESQWLMLYFRLWSMVDRLPSGWMARRCTRIICLVTRRLVLTQHCWAMGFGKKHQGEVDLATHSTGEDRAPSSSSPSLPRQSWRTHWSGTWLCSWRRWGHCWLTLWPRTKTQHGGGIQVVVGGWLVVVGGGWWLGWFIPIS